jgi:hypothetical protein
VLIPDSIDWAEKTRTFGGIPSVKAADGELGWLRMVGLSEIASATLILKDVCEHILETQNEKLASV